MSTSNHSVYRDGDRWIKQPRPGSPEARSELARDAAVNRALGRSVGSTLEGGLTLPHLGSVLSRDAFPVAEIAAALIVMHRTPIDASLLLTPEGWFAHTRSKVDERLRQRPTIRRWCHQVLESVGPPPAGSYDSPGLASSDPHAGNWCRDSEGLLQPIDFETACWANLSMSMASLMHTAVTLGYDTTQVPHPIDDTGRWFFTVKGVSALSWLGIDNAHLMPGRLATLVGSEYWIGGSHPIPSL